MLALSRDHFKKDCPKAPRHGSPNSIKQLRKSMQFNKNFPQKDFQDRRKTD